MPRLNPEQLRRRQQRGIDTNTSAAMRRIEYANLMRAKFAKEPRRIKNAVLVFAAIDGYDDLALVPGNRLRRYMEAARRTAGGSR